VTALLDMVWMKLQARSLSRALLGMHIAQNSTHDAIGTFPLSAAEIGNSTALMRPGYFDWSWRLSCA
jgi:hypothetical protein